MSLRKVLTSGEVSPGYKLATILAFLAFLIMAGTILYGFIFGDFAGEGNIMLSTAWGRVSLIDVYIGFFLYCGWILYREPTFLRALPWLVLMMIFGNATAGLYAFLALLQAEGDWRAFWLGKRTGPG